MAETMPRKVLCQYAKFFSQLMVQSIGLFDKIRHIE